MSTLNNKYEIENIIRKTLEENFTGRPYMPFYADDSKKGIGHTFKYHRSSPFAKIWPDVLKKLHRLGMTEWQMSNLWDYTNEDMPKPAEWIGIRNERLPRGKK